jgi:hypothetical protein
VGRQDVRNARLKTLPTATSCMGALNFERSVVMDGLCVKSQDDAEGSINALALA